MNNNVSLIKRFLIICSAPIALFVLTMIYLSFSHELSLSSGMNVKKFNKEKWRKSIYKIEMYKDLEENYLKIGMPWSEVMTMLGKPSLRRIYNTNLVKKECFQYHMGAIRSYQLSTAYILIVCPNNDHEILNSYKLIKDNVSEGGEVIFNR